jgi:hypothetical protein
MPAADELGALLGLTRPRIWAATEITRYKAWSCERV